MGKVKDTQQKVIDKCYAIYQQEGYSAVIDHVADMKALGKPEYENVKYERCTACETDMPSLNGTCLCCGQETKPFYFNIVKQGWNKDLKREEIQIHCGENANLFLIKTDEGFIVDVYNNDNNVDTMTVWEDDLTPSREKMTNYIMENEFGDDRDRDYERNLAFLESLDDEDLEERYDKVKFETDHQD